MGFPKIPPPPFKAPNVLSSVNFRRRSRLGGRLQYLPLGPSSPFLTTSMVFSAWYRAGLLHPAAGHGVHYVSCIRRLAPSTVANDGLRGLRAIALLVVPTLRSFPLDSSPNRVTATGALSSLALTSLSLYDASAVFQFVSRRPQPQGFLPLPSPLQALRRCRRLAARCSLGLQPSE